MGEILARSVEQLERGSHNTGSKPADDSCWKRLERTYGLVRMQDREACPKQGPIAWLDVEDRELQAAATKVMIIPNLFKLLCFACLCLLK